MTQSMNQEPINPYVYTRTYPCVYIYIHNQTHPPVAPAGHGDVVRPDVHVQLLEGVLEN